MECSNWGGDGRRRRQETLPSTNVSYILLNLCTKNSKLLSKVPLISRIIYVYIFVLIGLNGLIESELSEKGLFIKG